MRWAIAISLYSLLIASCGDDSPSSLPQQDQTLVTATATAWPVPEPTGVPVWHAGDPSVQTDELRSFIIDIEAGNVLETDGTIVAWAPSGEVIVASRTTHALWTGQPGGVMREAWDSSGFDRSDGPYLDGRLAVPAGSDGDLLYFVGKPPVPGPGRQLPPFELRLRTVVGEDALIASFDQQIDGLPTVSADGRFAAVSYFGSQPSHQGFYIVDVLERRTTIRVTNAARGEWLDSHRLHYTSNVCGGGQPPVIDGTPAPFVEASNIDLLDGASGSVTHLAATDAVEQYGVASPDGSTIAYVATDLASDPTGDEIVVVDTSTGDPRTLVRGNGLLLTVIVSGPMRTWSPDGRYLAFEVAGNTYVHGLCHDSPAAQTTVERLP